MPCGLGSWQRVGCVRAGESGGINGSWVRLCLKDLTQLCGETEAQCSMAGFKVPNGPRVPCPAHQGAPVSVHLVSLAQLPAAMDLGLLPARPLR